MVRPALFLLAGAAVGCSSSHGSVDPPLDPSPPDRVRTCEARYDLNGDGFADLVVPQHLESDASVDPPALEWSAEIYLGGPRGYREPLEFRWTEGWGHNLIAYSRGDERGVGVTDVAFYPYQQSSAIGNCEPHTIIRAEGDLPDGPGELVQVTEIQEGCDPYEEPYEGFPSGYRSTGPSGTTPVGDVDGDGIDDVLRWEGTVEGDETTLELLAPDGRVVATAIDTISGSRMYAGIGDVDGDGFADVLGWKSLGDEVQPVLFSGGPSGLGAPRALGSVSLASGAFFVTRPLGDINGDGAIDLFLRSYETPRFPDAEHAIATSVEGRFEWTVVPLDGEPWNRLIPIGDVDCDGFDDVAAKLYDESFDPNDQLLRLQVYRGTADGVREDVSIVIPRGANGTDILPVYEPLFRKIW